MITSFNQCIIQFSVNENRADNIFTGKKIIHMTNMQN